MKFLAELVALGTHSWLMLSVRVLPKYLNSILLWDLSWDLSTVSLSRWCQSFEVPAMDQAAWVW